MTTTARARRPLKARFASRCPNCDCPINVGDEITRDGQGGYKHADCPEIFGTGVGARNGYAHWNEEADRIWWQECGRFGE
jgi:hypothetical protein